MSCEFRDLSRVVKDSCESYCYPKVRATHDNILDVRSHTGLLGSSGTKTLMRFGRSTSANYTARVSHSFHCLPCRHRGVTYACVRARESTSLAVLTATATPGKCAIVLGYLECPMSRCNLTWRSNARAITLFNSSRYHPCERQHGSAKADISLRKGWKANDRLLHAL